MKKLLAVLICLALLAVVTGCQADPGGLAAEMGFSKPDNNSAEGAEILVGNYDMALSAIEQGNLLAAYEQLTHCDDPRAEETLKKLVFVPTTTSLSISNGNEFSTEYTYDEQGNILRILSYDKGDKTETLYTYDEAGRMLTEMHCYDHGNINITYDYNEKGLLIRHHRLDYNGSESTRIYTYDGQGRLIKERLDTNYDGSDHTVTYTYSADGLTATKKAAFDTGEVFESELACDADGNLLYDDQPDEDKVQYTYDEQGRIATETANGVTTVYTYEGDGKTPVSATTEGGNWTRQETYDENGWRIEKVTTYGDGNPETVTRSYDEYGNLTDELLTTGGGETYTSRNTWTLKYYPNGVPDMVAQKVEGVWREPETGL